MKTVWQTHLVPDPPVDETHHAGARIEITSFFAGPPGPVVDVGWVRSENLTVRCPTREDVEDLHAMQLVVEARVMPGGTP